LIPVLHGPLAGVVFNMWLNYIYTHTLHGDILPLLFVHKSTTCGRQDAAAKETK